MIISKINGGLGNQMFQYAIGRALAEKNSCELKLDLSAYSRYELFSYRLAQFNIHAETASPADVKSLKGSDSLPLKLLRKMGIYKNHTYYSEKERTIFDESVFRYCNVYLEGYWQNYRYFFGIRDALLEELRPASGISQDALEYLDDIRSKNSISIHIRRGDYLKHPDIGVLGLRYYRTAVEHIFETVAAPSFFIFSDDIEWCKSNFCFLDEKVFVQNTRDEIDDMVLMSECKHNIIANSTFSWWAAWLNKNEGQIVVSPKRWVAHNPRQHTWVPETWAQL